MKVKFIIHCWLNVEGFLGVAKQPFMQKVRNKNWSITRIKLFNTYTLPSLINQSFEDFEIFLFVGRQYPELLDRITKHPRLHLIDDFGGAKYTREIDSDFVNITRTDSDDMLRNDFMEEVAERADPQKYRTCLVFKKVLQWNIYHQFISDYRLPRSPFCSHTFPRSIYSDWKQFSVQQFMDYKSCQRRGTEGKVCIVRHNDNVTWPRIGKNPKSQAYLMQEKSKRNSFTSNRDQMFKILEPFGVQKDMLFWKA